MLPGFLKQIVLPLLLIFLPITTKKKKEMESVHDTSLN